MSETEERRTGPWMELRASPGAMSVSSSFYPGVSVTERGFALPPLSGI